MTTPLQTNRNDENDSYTVARKSILGAADKAAGEALRRDLKAAAEAQHRAREADRRHRDALNANGTGAHNSD